MKRIPVKVENCPVIESIFEVRFDSKVDSQAVFPILYSRLHDDFPAIESLATSQIPEQIRSLDPNFAYQPLYKLKHKDIKEIVMQIGPKVVAFSCAPYYLGWDKFNEVVTKYLSIIEETNVIDKILRIGYRVINFISQDVYKDNVLELVISQSGSPIPYEETALKTVFTDEPFKSVVNIVNCAQLNNSANGVKRGSIIDVDTFALNCSGFLADKNAYLDSAHAVEKKVFFNLLTDSFAESLKPSYENR